MDAEGMYPMSVRKRPVKKERARESLPKGSFYT